MWFNRWETESLTAVVSKRKAADKNSTALKAILRSHQRGWWYCKQKQLLVYIELKWKEILLLGSWFSFHRCNNSSFSWWPNTDVKKRSAQFINHIMFVFQILEPKDIRSWLIRFLPNCLETLPFNKADHSTWIGVGSMWPVLWCHALGNVYWMAELTYNFIINIIINIFWRAIKCLHRTSPSYPWRIISSLFFLKMIFNENALGGD